MNEEAVLLGPAKSLVAIYTPAFSIPPIELSSGKSTTGKDDQPNDLAVILLNSGLIHHAGPAGLYRKLAQAFSKQGVASVRFDLSGIGDSPPRADNAPIYEIATREPIEVMDDLQSRGFNRFILLGICSGAYCAYQTALKDERVVGISLINVQDVTGDTEWETKAWSKRYWTNSIFRLGAWKNLLTGKVNYQRLFRVLGEQLKPSRTQQPEEKGEDQEQNSVGQDMHGLAERGVHILFLSSGMDVSREQLAILLGDWLPKLLSSGKVTSQVIDNADHLFTLVEHQQKMLQKLGAWVAAVAASDHR